MKKLTTAQLAVQQKAHQLIDKVGEPFTGSDWVELITALKQVEPRTIWGATINWAIREGQDMAQLVDELSSQAVDDPFTMMTIVGPDATILLLRFFKR